MSVTWFREPRYAWIGLGSLWIIGFIGALTRFISAYFQVQISADLGISRGFISMAWSTNLFITALCAPLSGWLVDRYGPKKVMLLSSVMGIAGTGIVTSANSSPLFFFIGYGVISGFVGLGTTTTYMLMFKWFQHHRAKAAALLASASSVGIAVTTPIFVSASWLTWKDAFLVSFILGIIISLPVIWFGINRPDPNQTSVEESATLRVDNSEKHVAPPNKAIPSHFLIFMVVAGALFTCGFNMGTVEMNLVAIHQLASISPGMIALSMSVLGMMEIVGSLLYGYGLDRFNKWIMMILLYGIRVMGFAVLFMHVEWSPILFAVAFGITYLSAIPGGLLIVNEYTNGKGKQAGFLLLFHQGGGILGAMIGGVSFDYFMNYQVLIGVDLLICLLITLGYFFLYTIHKRKKLL